MVSIENEIIEGKAVTRVVIQDCQELEKKVRHHLDIINQVDAQAMDGHERNLSEIENDVLMGIVGHIIVCELLKANDKPCELNFDTEGFHLTSNEHSIKVRSSLAKVPPCPDKHIDKFTITGYADGDVEYDYYIQIVFCAPPSFDGEENCIEGMYIVGGVDKNSLNLTKNYGKKTMRVAMISTAMTINQIITKL